MIENEIWKEVQGFEDYQISNFGQVKSLKFRKERILKPCNINGHLSVVLYVDGKCFSFMVYKLIYETFTCDKLKDNECIHHKNENSLDNNLNNLQKMTISEHTSLHKTGNKHSMFGKMGTMLGKHHTIETKTKISGALKLYHSRNKKNE